MKYKLFLRDAADAEGPWTEVITARTLAGAKDEVAGWSGPRLRHGDLVRVSGGVHESLYVFDGWSSSSLVWCPAKFSVAFWEGPEADAHKMITACSGLNLDLRRVVLAGCDCADTSLGFVVAGDDRARVAIDAARNWCVGKATVREVRAAREAATAASVWYGQAGGDAAARLTMVAASEACRSASNAAGSAVSAGFWLDQFVVSRAAHAVTNAATCGFHSEAFAAVPEAVERLRGDLLRAMSPLVRRHVPLSAVACAALGLRDPSPLPERRSRGAARASAGSGGS